MPWLLDCVVIITNVLSLGAQLWLGTGTANTNYPSRDSFTITNSCNHAGDGFSFVTVGTTQTAFHRDSVITINNIQDNAGCGINLNATNTSFFGFKINVDTIKNNGSHGIVLGSNTYSLFFMGEISGNAGSGISGVLGFCSKMYGAQTSSNVTSGWSTGTITLDQYMINAGFSDGTPLVFAFTTNTNQKVFIQGAGNNHCTYMEGGQIISETIAGNTHEGSGIAWKLQPTSTARYLGFPVELRVAVIACEANKLVTVKAWFKRDSSAVTGRLVCRMKQLAGITTDQVDVLSEIDTWEELILTFTPTVSGVVEIVAQAYGGTTATVWVDDMTITQAA